MTWFLCSFFVHSFKALQCTSTEGLQQHMLQPKNYLTWTMSRLYLVMWLLLSCVLTDSFSRVYFLNALSRHTVVCRVAHENRAHANYVSILTGTKKSWFSRVCNSMIFYPKNTKVAVEVPAYQGKVHTKFEENFVKRFWDLSEQSFKFFLLIFRLFALEKITVTCKLVLQSSWNLVHLWGVQRQLTVSILVRIHTRFSEL